MINASNGSYSGNTQITISDCMNIEGICQKYDIAPEIATSYSNSGLSSLYPWQKECFFESNVLYGKKNLVYCVPTGSGKTLIAELAIFKWTTPEPGIRKKTLFILPYISLVEEKVKQMKRLVTVYNRSRLSHAGIKVKGISGNVYVSARTLKSSHILICTIEKAAAIIDIFSTPDRINSLGCVVIDEFHNINDEKRGPILESIISKIKLINQVSHKKSTTIGIHSRPIYVQIIALSATINNVQCLADWLDAHMFETTFRPITLRKHAVIHGQIIDSKGNAIQNLYSGNSIKFQKFREKEWETEALVALTSDIITKGQQSLIFCPTKALCGETCIILGNRLKAPINGDTNYIERFNWINELKKLKDGSFNALEQYIPACLRGIAFHHAGLTTGERECIEMGFKCGIIKILACTSTLAAGVNMPANAVIIRGTRVGSEPLSIQQYNQMCGRAGRPGQTKDKTAHAYLLASAAEKSVAINLLDAPYSNVNSSLNPESDGGLVIMRMILDAFVARLVNSTDNAINFLKMTLIYHEMALNGKEENLIRIAELCIEYLIHSDILVDTCKSNIDDKSLGPSKFGCAIIQGGFQIAEAVIIYKSILNAKKSLNLRSNLHVLFLVTPLVESALLEPDWDLLYKSLDEYENQKQFTNPHGQYIANILKVEGVSTKLIETFRYQMDTKEKRQKFYQTANAFTLPEKAKVTATHHKWLHVDQWHQLGCCVRIWSAWILMHLTEGVSIKKLSNKLDNTSEMILSNLLNASQLMSRRVQRFCHIIGLRQMEVLTETVYPILLKAEGKDELIEQLLTCKKITHPIAHCLIANGIDSLLKLVNTKLSALKNILSRFIKLKNSNHVSEDDIWIEDSLYSNFETTTMALQAAARETLEYQTKIRDSTAINIFTQINNKEYSSFAKDEDSNSDNDNDIDSNSDCSDIEDEIEYEMNSDYDPREGILNDIQSISKPITKEMDYPSVNAWVSLSTALATRDSWGLLNGTVNRDRLKLKKNATVVVTSAIIKEKKIVGAKSSLQSCKEGNGFIMRHLRGLSHWVAFKSLLHSNCSCIGIQIVMRKLPIFSTCTEFVNTLKRWNDVLAVSGSQGYSTDDSLHSNISLIEKYEELSPKQSPNVLLGVALCFGGSESFYLPLPAPPPPLLPITNIITKISYDCDMNCLPDNCRELVCLYIGGFERFLDIPPSYMSKPNPCFYLNHLWANSTRAALRRQWKTSGSQPWKTLQYILSNPKITIVGINLQDQLTALFERGCSTEVNGPLEDPVIALSLLQANVDDEVSRLIIPKLNKEIFSDKHTHLPRHACFRAIGAIRKMSNLEILLKNKQLLSVFRNIEMPFVCAMSEIQVHGLPMSTSYYAQLTNEITDRQRMIETYFCHIEGTSFNLLSKQDVKALRKRILNDTNYDTSEKHNHLLQLLDSYQQLRGVAAACASILYETYNQRVRSIKEKVISTSTLTVFSTVLNPYLENEISWFPCEHSNLEIEIEKIPQQFRHTTIKSFDDREGLQGGVKFLLQQSFNDKLPMCSPTGRFQVCKQGLLVGIKELMPIPFMRISCKGNMNETIIFEIPANRVWRDDSERGAQPQEIEILNQNSIDQTIPTCITHPREGIVASEGYTLLSASYNCIALRILGHLSGECVLCEASLHPDPIIYIGARWIGVSESLVNHDVRSTTSYIIKCLCRGMGMDIAGLAKECELSIDNAEHIYQDFMCHHKRVDAFFQLVIEEGVKNHTVVNLMNRKLDISDGIDSENNKMKKESMRQAINFVIGSSIEDIIKIALVNILNTFRKKYNVNEKLTNGMKESPLNNYGYARVIIIESNSSLLLEIKDTHLQEVIELVRLCMEGVMDLQVPLKVDIKSGKNWGAML